MISYSTFVNSFKLAGTQQDHYVLDKQGKPLQISITKDLTVGNTTPQSMWHNMAMFSLISIRNGPGGRRVYLSVTTSSPCQVQRLSTRPKGRAVDARLTQCIHIHSRQLCLRIKTRYLKVCMYSISIQVHHQHFICPLEVICMVEWHITQKV